MKGFIEKFAGAIATGEGFFVPGALPQRNHNPGDLRDSPWLPRPKDKAGIVVFKRDAEGIAGLYHQLALDIARGHTLASLLSKYAPPTENNTSNYIRETARRLADGDPEMMKRLLGGGTGGVAPEPLWNFLEIEHIA